MKVIYKIENGVTHASPEVAKKITEALNIKFDDVFSLVEGE